MFLLRHICYVLLLLLLFTMYLLVRFKAGLAVGVFTGRFLVNNSQVCLLEYYANAWRRVFQPREEGCREHETAANVWCSCLFFCAMHFGKSFLYLPPLLFYICISTSTTNDPYHRGFSVGYCVALSSKR